MRRFTVSLGAAIALCAAAGSAAADPPRLTFSGYLRPQVELTQRPEAAPRDEFDFAVTESRAGLIASGEPVADFKVDLHVLIGAETTELVTEVKPVDNDNDGVPDQVDSKRRFDAAFTLERATVTWRPDPRLETTVGLRAIPFSAQSATATTVMVFPDLVPLHRLFVRDTDLGAMAHLTTFDKVWSVSAGAWNGTGRQVSAPGDGPLLSLRLDWNPRGEFPFRETDTSRGPLRIGLGGGVLFRQMRFFDATGHPAGRSRDLRAAASARVAIAGFTAQAELFRRQIADNVSSRPEVATGAYLLATYYHLVSPMGLAPIMRIGWLRDLEFVDPVHGSSFELGLAIYPRPNAPDPDYMRLALSYAGVKDAPTGERTHSGIAQFRVRW
jgi:hypothetical protein